MDRLFRKRTGSSSTSDKNSRHGPRPSAGPVGKGKEKEGLSEAVPGQQREHNGVGGKGGKVAEAAGPEVGEGHNIGKAPSLDVDIRNSLMLPALSQRFSVLLPSLSTLSTAPEESLRSLIASQRARRNGPALTEEEEELLLAELREQADDRWDGQPPSVDSDWASRGLDGQRQNRSRAHDIMTFKTTSPPTSSRSYLTTSVSSPSVLASSEDGQQSPVPLGGGTDFFSSPPTTSTSFTSFKTFGVGSTSPELPSPGATSIKTKSYGFSGGQGLREDEYIRRVKKSASHKDLKSPALGKKDEQEQAQPHVQATAREEMALPSMISPERANAYYKGGAKPRLSGSPTVSDRTTTPISSLPPNLSPMPRLPQGASIPTLVSPTRAPESPTSPTSPVSVSSNGVSQMKQRQSLLSGLTPAQVKRISMALEEIGGELRRSESFARRNVLGVEKLGEQKEGEEEEEMLAADKGGDQEQEQTPGDEKAGAVELEVPRRSVDVQWEEGSSQSATSSVFPWKVSPTNSTFTGNTATEPISPSRLPPSPRAHNLRVQLDEAVPPIPTPIFTPTRVQPTPTRHTPSLSNGSASSTPTQVPPSASYTPGQPRPVRLTHHSEGSMSSPSGTPSVHSPLDALRTSNAASRSQSPLDALRLSAASPDSHPHDASPFPLHHMHIAGTPSALGRSLSVNQTSTPQEPSTSFTRRRAGTFALGETISGRRLSSPMGTRVDVIDEDVEPQSESEGFEATVLDGNSAMPELKQVAGRHSVAASRYDSEASVLQLRPQGRHLRANGGLAPVDDHVERTVSAQGTIRTSYSTAGHSGTPSPALIPEHDVHRMSSTDSASSSFVEPEADESAWASLLDSRRESLDVPSPGEVMDGEMLKKMSGLGLDELAELQGKLVAKAKMEREALGLSDSPAIPYTPTMPVEPFSPTIQRPLSPLGAQAMTPPMSGRQAPIAEQRAGWDGSHPTLDKAPAASSEETRILTPPATSTVGPAHSRSSSKPINPTRAAPPVPSGPVPSGPAPPAPSDAPFQPPPTDLSRTPSGKAGARILADDPEVERDFRTRIAAATAALNRNPSVQSGRLERKGTKRGGAMIISSPKLLSSTANVPTIPLTSPSAPVDPAVAKSLEKASGSGSKMSLRWKKLMRKGPSISGNDSTFKQPATPQSAPPEVQPMRMETQTPSQLQRSASSATGRVLDAPIHLRVGDETGVPPPSAPPNLNMFRFPPQKEVQTPRALAAEIEPRVPSPDNEPNPTLAQSLGQSHIPTPPTTAAPTSSVPQIKEPETHSRVASEDSAVLAFLEAGRQIGLSEEQLNEVLVTKGTVKRSGTTATTASTSSHRTATPTEATAFSRLSPVLPGVAPQQLPAAREKEKKGGLFRSLSKKARGATARPQTPDSSRVGMRTPEPTRAIETPPPPSERVHDKVVVRRTMIMPDGLVIVPSTPQRASMLQDSPELDLGRRPSQRKPSIRRKPLNLSKEDHALVSNSPPPHQPRFSINASPSQLSDIPAQDGSGKGMGFLYPGTALGAGDLLRSRSNASESMSRSSISGRSSAGGSLIDMYRDDYDESEVLQDSPDLADRRQSGSARVSLEQGIGSTQAVEIREYADGEVVWSIVDALRTSVAGSVDGEEYVFDGEHSRSSSYSSRRDSTMTAGGTDVFNGTWPRNGGLATGVQGLNFRHKDRSAVAKPRPPTDVYFTSSRDVADLIDHLSRDLDASRGRIDILPYSHSRSSSHSPAIDSEGSPFPFQSPERREPASPSAKSQFEDAPSPAPPPRRAPPPAGLLPPSASVNVPAGGFSPKRQLFFSQGIGHRQGQMSVTSMGSGAGMSPSAKSFSSSVSGVPGKSVEERLQELMDRMRGEGLMRE